MANYVAVYFSPSSREKVLGNITFISLESLYSKNKGKFDLELTKLLSFASI